MDYFTNRIQYYMCVTPLDCLFVCFLSPCARRDLVFSHVWPQSRTQPDPQPSPPSPAAWSQSLSPQLTESLRLPQPSGLHSFSYTSSLRLHPGLSSVFSFPVCSPWPSFPPCSLCHLVQMCVINYLHVLLFIRCSLSFVPGPVLNVLSPAVLPSV